MNSNPQEQLVIKTSRFGELTIPGDKVLDMPQGMVGFPQQHRWVMLKHGENSPFQWLQSVDAPELAFVLVTPLVFDPKYHFELGKTETALLKVDDPGQLQVWVVVNIPHGQPKAMTGNLKAPVVINLANRMAAQVILEADYSLRQALSGS